MFFAKIITLPYLDIRTKLRLLERKRRRDLEFYESGRLPDLQQDEVATYKALEGSKTAF
jgi:hypothetical protein